MCTQFERVMIYYTSICVCMYACTCLLIIIHLSCMCIHTHLFFISFFSVSLCLSVSLSVSWSLFVYLSNFICHHLCLTVIYLYENTLVVSLILVGIYRNDFLFLLWWLGVCIHDDTCSLTIYLIPTGCFIVSSSIIFSK